MTTRGKVWLVRTRLSRSCVLVESSVSKNSRHAGDATMRRRLVSQRLSRDVGNENFEMKVGDEPQSGGPKSLSSVRGAEEKLP